MVSRVVQVALGHNVIAIKDRPSLVTGDRHGHAFRHTGPHHVPDSGAPKIVEQLPAYACTLTGGLPRHIKIANTPPGPREHVLAFREAQVSDSLLCSLRFN